MFSLFDIKKSPKLNLQMSSFVQPSKPPKLFIGYQISQKKQEILTFKKLEQANVGHFCVKKKSEMLD